MKKKFKQIIIKTSLITTLGLALLPKLNEKANISNVVNAESISNDDFLLNPVGYDLYVEFEKSSNITKEDLINCEGLNISLTEERVEDFSFLNYCTNLENLYIDITSPDLYSLTNIFKELPNKDINVDLTIIFDELPLTEDNVNAIKSIPFDTSLSFYGRGAIDSNLFENLSVSKVTISDSNGNIDYSKLKNVDKLIINTKNPYNVAINMTTDVYNELINNNVKICCDEDFETNCEEENEKFNLKIKEINNKLDNIYNSLNINDSMSDEEKLKIITIYVLDNLTYDKEVQSKNEQNEQLNLSFYEGPNEFEQGELYGALERDTQICGNYAALVSALARRANLESYLINSETHSWNLVKLNNNYYYTDSTWIDDDKPNSEEELNDYYYLFNPLEVDLSLDHNAVNLPSWLDIKPDNNIENNQTTQEPMYEVTIEDKKWHISKGALVCILLSIGAFITYKKKSSHRR